MRCAPFFFLTLPAAFALELGSNGRKAAVAARLNRLDLAGLQRYTYANFVNDFQRGISPESSNSPAREAVFNANLAKVVALRANPQLKWVPSVTKFMDYHEHEFGALLGYKGRRSRAGAAGGMRQQSVGGGFSGDKGAAQQVPGAWGAAGAAQGAQGGVREHVPEHKVPHSFTIFGLNSTVSLVRDQDRCGSCWAEAALTTLEGAIEKDWQLVGAIRKLGVEPRLSRDQAISCARNPLHCGGTGACDGATAEMAFRLAREDGIALQQDILSAAAKDGVAPQCQAPDGNLPRIFIDSYMTLPKNRDHLKEVLISQATPVAVAVDASNWKHYSSGVYSDTDSGSDGEFTVNHVVSLVGYDTTRSPHPYYLIKNSWGPEWGEAGFIRLEIKDDEQNHCGWDRAAHLGVACDGDPDKAWVCGTCGILFDASYASGIRLVGGNAPATAH